MKVVYNNRYGGFSLSAEAREWLIARRWRFADKLSEPCHGMVSVEDVPRHDALLVECVETLGARASGEGATLAIETVECAYEITEYDGNETVHERYVNGYTEEDVAQRVADAVATARAEAALAEREACAAWFDDRAANYERRSAFVSDNPASFGGGSIAQDVVETLAEKGAQARLDAQTIRARTTPATLSTDTLAAIAKARGLCLVPSAEVVESRRESAAYHTTGSPTDASKYGAR